LKPAFEQRLAADWPPAGWQEVTVVVAVSGGADSVALLRALQALKTAGAGRLIAAHCNHRLRGDASEGDAAFVKELCQRLRVPCEVGMVDVPASERGDGLEAAARGARYAFLSQIAQQHGARYLATAHTADDQAETILHRIVRGTGLAGLAGIPRVRPLNPLTTLIRPLLWARRHEVLEYLSGLDQDFRQDATNLESRFTRNRIRLELLPQLAEQFNPAIVEALLRLGQLAGEAQEVLSSAADELFERAVSRMGSAGWRIDARPLHGQPRYLIREMLIGLWRQAGWPEQSMGLTEWQRLAELLTSEQPATHVLPGNVTAQWNPTQACLELTRK
jgi:tRNA(Ile)-lysidine synthase